MSVDVISVGCYTCVSVSAWCIVIPVSEIRYEHSVMWSASVHVYVCICEWGVLHGLQCFAYKDIIRVLTIVLSTL